MKMKNSKLLSKKDLMKTFWRSFTMEWAWNYERQMNLGYAYSMVPALKKIYGNNKEKLREAYKRHLEFYNVTPWLSTFPLGISIAMEEQNELDPEFDSSSINNIKVALMGPLSGIGDSFFWGTLRVIATALALPLAKEGNVLGPILFLVAFNVPHLILRYYSGVLGYELGTNLLTNISSSTIFNKISKAATIIGLMVIGAMSAQMVILQTPLEFHFGKTAFKLQTYIDQIFPLLLPLLYTLFIFWLLKSKKKSSTFVLLVTIVVGLVGSFIGIF